MTALPSLRVDLYAHDIIHVVTHGTTTDSANGNAAKRVVAQDIIPRCFLSAPHILRFGSYPSHPLVKHGNKKRTWLLSQNVRPQWPGSERMDNSQLLLYSY